MNKTHDIPGLTWAGSYIKKPVGLGRRQVSQRRRDEETWEGLMTLGLTWVSWTETRNSSRSAGGSRISAPKLPLADDMGQCWRWKCFSKALWDTFSSPHFQFLRLGDWLWLDLITGVMSKQKPTEFCRLIGIPQVSAIALTTLLSTHPSLQACPHRCFPSSCFLLWDGTAAQVCSTYKVHHLQS